MYFRGNPLEKIVPGGRMITSHDVTLYKKKSVSRETMKGEKMANEVVTMIGTVGFPIAMCLIMSWFIYDNQKSNREQLEKITESHRTEMESVKDALVNNTIAVDKLASIMEGYDAR